ncbi:CHRD domain-containing protein [Flavobacterium sp. GT3P67]|uniref:CHRD domain-containing protein n=1 Tax=Flavobacterium sp. GT3P67 TaxID=2541722 RepID=UPI001052CBB4|nr:CHRD domain-containing protein [Flavobacterium sp. GT3P67]TDE50156.1 CHRD domain-containing protein [Flavobacterium sp. GT3P67]
MKCSIRFLAVFIILLGLVSCDGDDPAPTPVIVTFNATLKGTNEVPTNNSTATGTAVLYYNKTTKAMSLTVTYSGLTVTDSHIHVGAVTVDGPVVFPLTTSISPITYTSPALSASQQADLLANLYYVNLHSAAFTGGEIRGQLITTNPGGSGGGGGY